MEAAAPPTVQAFWLFVLALPVATSRGPSRTKRSSASRASGRRTAAATAASVLARKFYYICTCEYCFSHYVAAGFIALTEFHLLLTDWRGYLIAWFAVVAVANLYMSLFGRLRVDIKSEGLEAKVKEQDLAIKARVIPDPPPEA